jgi:hypothetical protein
MFKLKIFAASLVVAAFSFCTACSPQAKHPNQLSVFDGASYDSLTVAHAALASLRQTVSLSYPQYKDAFNQAAASYELAFDAYSTFRSFPANEPQTAMAIGNLTVSMGDLENAFQNGMHAQSKVVRSVRQRALKIRAANAGITISDILTELEVAATIAASVPGAQPYAALAQIVIAATQTAVQAINAGSGQPIDLTTLTPIAIIR